MPDARLQRTRENYRETFFEREARERAESIYYCGPMFAKASDDWVAEQMRLLEQIQEHGVNEPGYGAGV